MCDETVFLESQIEAGPVYTKNVHFDVYDVLSACGALAQNWETVF